VNKNKKIFVTALSSIVGAGLIASVAVVGIHSIDTGISNVAGSSKIIKAQNHDAATKTSNEVISIPEVSTAPAAPKKLDGDLDGDGEISVWEQEQINKSNYHMPDGSIVKIPEGGALPATVQAAVTNAIAPAANTYRSASMSTNGQYVDGFLQSISDQEDKTGKTIIAVYSGPSPAGHGWFVSETSIDAGTLNGFGSEAAALAAVQAYTQGSSDYAVVTFG
jgi:hypothetical protein